MNEVQILLCQIQYSYLVYNCSKEHTVKLHSQNWHFKFIRTGFTLSCLYNYKSYLWWVEEQVCFGWSESIQVSIGSKERTQKPGIAFAIILITDGHPENTGGKEKLDTTHFPNKGSYSLLTFIQILILNRANVQEIYINLFKSAISGLYTIACLLLFWSHLYANANLQSVWKFHFKLHKPPIVLEVFFCSMDANISMLYSTPFFQWHCIRRNRFSITYVDRTVFCNWVQLLGVTSKSHSQIQFWSSSEISNYFQGIRKNKIL